MTAAGKAYGEALYALCQEEGLSDRVLSEFAVLETSFAQTPEFIRLLSSPTLTKEERCGIVENIFRGYLQPYLLNFLKILTNHGHVRYFSDCFAAYRKCYDRDQNILPVTVTTAEALTKEQADRLTRKLSQLTGKRIRLHNQVDSTVIGGVRLDYDGRRLDDTLAHRMDSIYSLLKNTAL